MEGLSDKEEVDMSPRKNNLLIDFKVSFIKDMGGNYLVVKLPQQQKIVLHQLEIINRNLPLGIIPIEKREINNQTALYYCLNSYVPFSYYLEKEEITSGELIKILDEIVNILLQSKNYLLYAASFLLHPDYIYLSAGRQEVFLLYLPVKLPGNVNANFRELLKKVVSVCADFPQNLVAYNEEQFFNLQGFREQVKKIKFSELKKGEEIKERVKPFHLESEVFLSRELQHEEGEKNSLLKDFTLKKKFITVFGLFQLIILVVLMLLSPWLNSFGNTLTIYGGLALLIVVFNLLILRFFSLKYPHFKL
jgi:hypothetical protein